MLAAKLSYYLLLSCIGVFFAEVMSWSALDVLYNPAKFIILTPVYAVHLILFEKHFGQVGGEGTGRVTKLSECSRECMRLS